jgi:hypothetical protein
MPTADTCFCLNSGSLALGGKLPASQVTRTLLMAVQSLRVAVTSHQGCAGLSIPDELLRMVLAQAMQGMQVTWQTTQPGWVWQTITTRCT